MIASRVRYFPQKILALTFDDGPSADVTPMVLKALAAHHARATFFVLGQNASLHPELLRAEAARGSAVENHSYDHPASTSRAEAEQELSRTEAIIRKATGRAPVLFRPPYGITRGTLAKLALAKGYAVVTWTISSADTRPISPEMIANNVIHTPNPGDIVLMHDGAGHHATALALPIILDQLGRAGWRFVTLPGLLHAWAAGAQGSTGASSRLPDRSSDGLTARRHRSRT